MKSWNVGVEEKLRVEIFFWNTGLARRRDEVNILFFDA